MSWKSCFSTLNKEYSFTFRNALGKKARAGFALAPQPQAFRAVGTKPRLIGNSSPSLLPSPQTLVITFLGQCPNVCITHTVRSDALTFRLMAPLRACHASARNHLPAPRHVFSQDFVHLSGQRVLRTLCNRCTARHLRVSMRKQHGIVNMRQRHGLVNMRNRHGLFSKPPPLCPVLRAPLRTFPRFFRSLHSVCTLDRTCLTRATAHLLSLRATATGEYDCLQIVVDVFRGLGASLIDVFCITRASLL